MTKTLINLDDKLFHKVQKITGIEKKVEIVNLALRKLLEQKQIEKILELKGKVAWIGNLQKMRKNRK